MKSLSVLIEEHGVDVLDHLDRDALVPTIAGLQAQGDIIIVPAAMSRHDIADAVTPVPPRGVAVVRGENGGNTHLLLVDGDVRWDTRPVSTTDLRLGVLTVKAGAIGFLIHPEHGAAGVAPGTYEIRRQREQSDEIRLVQD